jgi:ATP-binding cassette, subfamily B, bacterial
LQDTANTFYAAKVMRDLYADSFSYLLDHSYTFFISNFAGTLTHRVSRFVRSFESISDTILTQFLPTFLFVSGAIGVLYLRNHTLGIILGGWALLFIAFQVYIAKLRQPSRAARAEADTKVTGTLADAISNHSTVMQFAGTVHERGLLDLVVNAWRKATLRSWLIDGWTWGVIGLFVIAIQTALLYGAIVYWQRGLLTVGDFVLIQSYLIGTFNQLMGIGYQLRRFYDSFAEAGEMVEILDRPHEITDKTNALPLTVNDAQIVFDGVSFSFTDTRDVLERFSVTIPGGQKVALVGPSGAGKSTLTRLLLRMFDVKGGAITIDRQDIRDVTQESLRLAISFVPQEPILFHRSLMENIRYGKQDATDEQVVEAARKAHCHEFIDELPDKYNTFVGERGVKLSGGERQRVAIARAILKDAPILVLDEATSSLDSQSEMLIQQALDVLMQGKTVLVIAHRLSTIMKMDRILVLEHGKVVADGTHAQLLAEDGLYAKLWSIQAGGFLVPNKETDTHRITSEESVVTEIAEEETDRPDDAEPLAEGLKKA